MLSAVSCTELQMTTCHPWTHIYSEPAQVDFESQNKDIKETTNEEKKKKQKFLQK